MSIVHSEMSGRPGAASLPLLVGSSSRVVAWREGTAVTATTFLAHVRQVAATLPEADSAVNLCEDRYAFLVAFAALVLRGQTNLLPPSRAAHAPAAALCRAFGAPLVSTSANPHGDAPARDVATLARYFGDRLDGALDAALGDQERPTTIRDALSGAIIRA